MLLADVECCEADKIGPMHKTQTVCTHIKESCEQDCGVNGAALQRQCWLSMNIARCRFIALGSTCWGTET